MAVTSSSKQKRIDVQVPPSASMRQQRELVAFARYCVQRIEKDLGERQQWLVELAISRGRYAAFVEVQHLGLVLEARGAGNDGALAIWDAMCRIEQDIRDRRGAVFAPRPAND